MSQIALGFIPDPMTINFDKLLPSRKLPENVITSRKYKQIIESLRSVGLIEPLTISPSASDGTHVLLDGHKYIQQNQPDVFSEFATIVETVSMDK
jgi:hypothetical protein